MKKKYFYSVISSIIGQFVTIICGIILPRVLIGQYGSELYGATTSITQFLGYIALLEGGIGGVGRAALYKPLVDGNKEEINKIVSSIQKFFRIIAAVFVIYALILACTYKYIAKETTLDWTTSFLLVVVIAASSIAQYYFGITNAVLLQADQKIYITTILNTSATFLNTIISCVLAYAGMGMIGLKLAWCGVHVVRIILLNLYVKKNYNLRKIRVDRDYLPQKWDGLGQHIAYFLHSHTDVVVLTMFVNLKEVSVYSIYNYVCSSLATLTLSFAAGQDAILGKTYASGNLEKLNKYFDYIEFIVNTVAIIFFSVATALILPFVSVYTNGIEDANYYRPVVGYLMLSMQFFYCLRNPYHQMIICAGHFKETKNAAYTEAGMNIVFSLILVNLFGMEGLVAATLISVVYRMIYYVIYLKKNILYRKIISFLKRISISFFIFCINIIVFSFVLKLGVRIEGYMDFFIVAILYFTIVAVLTLILSFLFYREHFQALWRNIRKKVKGDL